MKSINLSITEDPISQIQLKIINKNWKSIAIKRMVGLKIFTVKIKLNSF
jgi:hypothetical protein